MMAQTVNPNRIHTLVEGEIGAGPVVYWMSRDQRVADNWALLYAKKLADETRSPLAVIFNLAPEFLDATTRHYEFILNGMEQVEIDLLKLNIPMFLLPGNPEKTIPSFVKKQKIASLVTDFNPLKISKGWKNQVRSKITIPFYEVDAHNIVPVWIASNKQEYAAYTIRPKIHKHLDEYLTDYPKLYKHKHKWPGETAHIDWRKARKTLKVDNSEGEVDWLKPGEHAAVKAMSSFFKKRLPDYYSKRNDPNHEAQSNLSPYLHFGQLSAQRLAYETQRFDADITSQEAFLEELIIRRELADNYCHYASDYDNFDGLPAWARDTLEAHSRDKREYIYTLDQFESGVTHDELWNAAQREMVITGKMHGYMRMYWAKKILEWTETPRRAQEIAIYLNDRNSLDGRDPNGYAGIAWSIGGLHDRAWAERKIFGKIRYMNYNGCRRKFDVPAYIDRINNIRIDK